MPGNFTHCVRFKQLRCKSVADFDERYSCSFREYTNNGPWPKRQIVVEKLKGTWTKISGDTPTCAVMDLNTEPTQGKM